MFCQKIIQLFHHFSSEIYLKIKIYYTIGITFKENKTYLFHSLVLNRQLPNIPLSTENLAAHFLKVDKPLKLN